MRLVEAAKTWLQSSHRGLVLGIENGYLSATDINSYSSLLNLQMSVVTAQHDSVVNGDTKDGDEEEQ